MQLYNNRLRWDWKLILLFLWKMQISYHQYGKSMSSMCLHYKGVNGPSFRNISHYTYKNQKGNFEQRFKKWNFHCTVVYLVFSPFHWEKFTSRSKISLWSWLNLLNFIALSLNFFLTVFSPSVILEPWFAWDKQEPHFV